MGVTLHSLTVTSTNELWEKSFNEGHGDKSYKLLKLDSLALYIDNSVPLFDSMGGLDSEKYADVMRSENIVSRKAGDA